MLELKEITKVYPSAGENVEALRGIDLQFRSSEFVSVLGPSGCGKTTLLNIIGGLDQYTSGDLLINGRSTKDFHDRDWDKYRNYSIGFVFQSYNLIPHQSVLQNVELALTLSGVSKQERRKRAKEALEKVGLKSQMKKKPAEMSGGQMQRVAIARAIVNNPDIILADEPTGALDTETSVQVMEILKEISADRLVIMVTHNPQLANTYSTRIIQMLDGKIMADSAPLTAEDIEVETALDSARLTKETDRKKPSMSLRTSFGLSLKNLISKKGRTILTSFAGSIGIIGIALIYAVSNGATKYIDTVQEDALSSYPLTLEAQHMDISSLLSSMMGKSESAGHEEEGVYQKTVLYDLINALSTNGIRQNDLKAFKTYLDKVRSDPQSESPFRNSVSGVQYTYDRSLLVYTRNTDGRIIASDLQEAMQELIGDYMQISMTGSTSGQNGTGTASLSSGSTSMMGSSRELWQEMLPGENGKLISPLVDKQYDVAYGSWPTRYDEIMLVVDKNGELSDLSLYALGLIPKEYMESLMRAAVNQETFDYEAKKWTYAEICDLDFRVILNADCYVLDQESGLYTDLRSTDAGLQYLYDNGLKLRVSGILKPKDDAVSTTLSAGIAYTCKLTEYLVQLGNSSDAVKAQLASPETDVITGMAFRDSGSLDDAQKAQRFRDYAGTLDDNGKARIYVAIQSIPTEEVIQQTLKEQMEGMDREKIEAAMCQILAEQMGVNQETVMAYLSAMGDQELAGMYSQLLTYQIQTGYAEEVQQRLDGVPVSQLAGNLMKDLPGYTDDQCAAYYDQVLQFSSSSYENNLKMLGYVDLDSPTTINLYAASFEDKDRIEEAIADYNRSVGEDQEITYTDYVGLIMSSVTTIIKAITYVLIAFVAISLVVSSIMIGVITLISVQERTKEIGILRSLGASKRNVSSLFNAETMMIGFASGILGIVVTWILCIPINAIILHLTDIKGLKAFLDIRVALILIAISMLLTLIAGVIPSRSAAKKDPVVALRTE